MKIVALVDGSTYSASVCDLAAWAAGRTKAPVDVLHVLGRRDTSSVPADLSGNLNADAREALMSDLVALDGQRAKVAQARGRLIVEQAVTRLRAAGVAQVGSRLRNGDLVETVELGQQDDALLVVGKRGEAADFASLHLGSNLERVVRASSRPVLVAARAFRPIQRVLIAFDGGATIERAVDHMAGHDLFRGLDCHLLMAGQETDLNRGQVARAAGRLAAGGLTVRSTIMLGHADQVIAAVVEREAIDLVVMGAYGHSRIRSLIIGSTTTEMIRSCRVPIYLYR